MEKFIYEIRPYFYLGLSGIAAIYALANFSDEETMKSILFLSASVLAFCGVLVIRARNSYRRMYF